MGVLASTIAAMGYRNGLNAAMQPVAMANASTPTALSFVTGSRRSPGDLARSRGGARNSARRAMKIKDEWIAVGLISCMDRWGNCTSHPGRSPEAAVTVTGAGDVAMHDFGRNNPNAL